MVTKRKDKRMVTILRPGNTSVTFYTVAEAAKAIHAQPTHIYRHLRTGKGTVKGYKLEWAKEVYR